MEHDNAFRCVDMIQGSIRHADMKVATMSTAVFGMGIFLAEKLNDAAYLAVAGPGYLVPAVLLTVAAVAGMAGASWHLGHALRPRLESSAATGRYGLLALAGLADAGPDPARLAPDAAAEPALPGREAEPPAADPGPAGDAGRDGNGWLLARALARIAVEKHQRVRRGLTWTGAGLLGTVGADVTLALARAIVERGGL